MSTVIGFDTETALIRPGRCAPPMTCLTWQTKEANGDVRAPDIVGVKEAFTHVAKWLSGDAVLTGANTAYDTGVICAEWPHLLPLVFKAYDEDRITDVQIRQKLLDIAAGCYRGRMGDGNKWIKYNYSLADLVKRLVGVPFKKEGFRLFYGPFRGVPLAQWTQFALELQERGKRWLASGPCTEHSDCLANPELAMHCADKVLGSLANDLGDVEKFNKELAGMVAADPLEAVTYPLEDASGTLAVHLAQEEHAEYLADQFRQARSAFWLHLTSAWGLRTSPLGVAKLQVATEKACNEVEARLVAAGLVRANGSRDTKAAKERMLNVCAEKVLVVRLTDSGEPSLDSDACKAVDDELLRDYAALTSLKGVLAKDVPALARASVYPIHTRFDLAETGRTTSSNPNVMNWRRLPGIRECFIPRPGRVFIQADYAGLELCTLAQACIDILGGSDLGEAINAGIDAHTDLAAQILGVTYDECKRRLKLPHEDPLYKAASDARQSAKVANFGFPGGLGIATLILFARKTYKTIITEDEARALKAQWFKKWPEMPYYFDHVNQLGDTLEQLRSKRIRAGASYTAKCNSYFQGLGADAAKAAGWLVTKACYIGEAPPPVGVGKHWSTPLYGSRPVNFVHDEIIGETLEADAPEAAEELSRLMVLGAQPWIPDIKLKAEPCVMRVWSKDAETLRDTNGRLMAWAPKEVAA